VQAAETAAAAAAAADEASEEEELVDVPAGAWWWQRESGEEEAEKRGEQDDDYEKVGEEAGEATPRTKASAAPDTDREGDKGGADQNFVQPPSDAARAAVLDAAWGRTARLGAWASGVRSLRAVACSGRSAQGNGEFRFKINRQSLVR
jgi:hypothetical protein